MFFVSEKGGCWWRVGPPTLEPFALSHYSRNVSVCCKLSSVYLCSSTAPDSSVPLEVLEVRFVYHLLDPSEGGCISTFIWNSPLTWISFTCKEKKKKIDASINVQQNWCLPLWMYFQLHGQSITKKCNTFQKYTMLCIIALFCSFSWHEIMSYRTFLNGFLSSKTIKPTLKPWCHFFFKWWS